MRHLWILSLLLSLIFLLQSQLVLATTVTALPTNLTSNIEFGPNEIVQITEDVIIPGGVIVKFGAGVRVLMATGANLVVSPGAKLFAVGTHDNPVVFTSSSSSNSIAALASFDSIDVIADDTQVDNWGSIVFCGLAPIDHATTALPFSTNSLELKCGGGNFDDNSGQLEHVRIERGRGLVLAGVGYGTIIHSLEAGFCSGVGIRVVGGTVNMRRISVVYNSGVGLQLSSAYSGKIQHVFAQVPDIAGSRGVQISGRNTAPIVSHATLLGSRDNTTQVMHFRDNVKGVFVNMLLVHYQGVGIYNDCTSAAMRNVSQPKSSGDNAQDGDGVGHSDLVFPMENTLWNPLENASQQGEQVVSVGCSPSQTFNVSKMRVGTISNPNLIALPKALNSWSREQSRVFDLRPDTDSTLLDIEQTNPAFYEPPGSGSFFEIMSHIGSFGQTDLWLTGLSALDTELHVLPDNIKADVVLCGKIDGTITIPAASNVVVSCSLLITGSLVVHDDVMVRVMPNDMSLEGHVPFIVVQQQGTLQVMGHPARPVTFTTAMNADYVTNVRSPGLWGGIIIQGDAVVSGGPRSFNSTALLGQFNVEQLTYGSSIMDELTGENSSGSMQYVRVWHAGTALGPGALVLAGIHKSTELQNVEVAWSVGVGLALLGGNPTINYISSIFNNGCAVIAAQGYNGQIEHLFAIAHISAAFQSESDTYTNETATEWLQTLPLVSHATLLGYDLITTSNGATGEQALFVVGSNAGGGLQNSVLASIDAVAFSGISIPCSEKNEGAAGDDEILDEIIQSFMLDVDTIATSLDVNSRNVIITEGSTCDNIPEVQNTAPAPYELFGCVYLELQINDGGGGVTVAGSSFDPRPTSYGDSLLLNVPASDSATTGMVLGAFQNTLWLDRLSWLDTAEQLFPGETSGSPLFNCTAAPTHKPTLFPSYGPTRTPSYSPSLGPGNTNAPSNIDGEVGSGDVKSNLPGGVGFISIILAFLLVAILAYIGLRVCRASGVNSGGRDGFGPIKQRRDIELQSQDNGRYSDVSTTIS